MEVAEEVTAVGLEFEVQLAADDVVVVVELVELEIAEAAEADLLASVPTHSIGHYQWIVKEGLQLLMVYYLWPFSTFEGYLPLTQLA